MTYIPAEKENVAKPCPNHLETWSSYMLTRKPLSSIPSFQAWKRAMHSSKIPQLQLDLHIIFNNQKTFFLGHPVFLKVVLNGKASWCIKNFAISYRQSILLLSDFVFVNVLCLHTRNFEIWSYWSL